MAVARENPAMVDTVTVHTEEEEGVEEDVADLVPVQAEMESKERWTCKR